MLCFSLPGLRVSSSTARSSSRAYPARPRRPATVENDVSRGALRTPVPVPALILLCGRRRGACEPQLGHRDQPCAGASIQGTPNAAGSQRQQHRSPYGSISKMADSFRAIAASKRLAAAALEARFDHLTSGPPSPRKPKPRNPDQERTAGPGLPHRVRAPTSRARRRPAPSCMPTSRRPRSCWKSGQDGRGGDREELLNSADRAGIAGRRCTRRGGRGPHCRWSGGSCSSADGDGCLDLDLDAVDADGCTPIWAAAYNGEYHCALWILSKGPNLELRGKASNTASCTPCNAARSQRNPTIADAIDAEIELRRQDPKRVASLKSGQYRLCEDLRGHLRNR